MFYMDKRFETFQETCDPIDLEERPDLQNIIDEGEFNCKKIVPKYA